MGRILTPRGYGDTITEDFNRIDLTEGDDVKRSKLEQWFAKNIGTALVRNFPNRQWKVIVDFDGGMLIIGCDSVSNTKGYYIKIKNRSIKELQKRACYAAAEILERYNLARSRRFDADKLETLVRDARDEVITADSAPEPI